MKRPPPRYPYCRLLQPAQAAFYATLIAELADRRRMLGISQESLDARLGVSEGMVSRWEQGVKLPGAFFFVCWAEALGIRITTIPIKDAA